MRILLLSLAFLGFAFVAESAEAQRAGKSFVPKIQASKLQKGGGQTTEDQNKKHRDLMWTLFDKGANKALGYVPSPSSQVGGMVWGCAFFAPPNIIIAAIRTGIEEDRELGHGEATGIFLNTCFNPLPVPIWNDTANQLWARFDLCKDRNVRDYPGLSQPEHMRIPKEALHAFYEEKYCNAPPDRRFDAFRLEARMKPPGSYSQVSSSRRQTPATRTFAMVQAPAWVASWEPPVYPAFYTNCAWPKFDARGNEIVEQNCVHLYN